MKKRVMTLVVGPEVNRIHKDDIDKMLAQIEEQIGKHPVQDVIEVHKDFTTVGGSRIFMGVLNDDIKFIEGYATINEVIDQQIEELIKDDPVMRRAFGLAPQGKSPEELFQDMQAFSNMIDERLADHFGLRSDDGISFKEAISMPATIEFGLNPIDVEKFNGLQGMFDIECHCRTPPLRNPQYQFRMADKSCDQEQTAPLKDPFHPRRKSKGDKHKDRAFRGKDFHVSKAAYGKRANTNGYA